MADRPQRHDGFFEAYSDVQWLHSPLSWVEMTMPEETEAGSAGKQPAKGLMSFSRHCFKPPTSALNGSCLTDTHRRKVGNYWAFELPCLPDSINRESQPEANSVLRTVWAIRMPI